MQTVSLKYWSWISAFSASLLFWAHLISVIAH
ncbi:TPA: small membrane protein YmiC [Citrobacter freundii]